MSSQHVGIETARKTLGDLVTAAQQGADIVLTRNGKPAARLIAYREPAMTIEIYPASKRLPPTRTERATIPVPLPAEILAWHEQAHEGATYEVYTRDGEMLGEVDTGGGWVDVIARVMLAERGIDVPPIRWRQAPHVSDPEGLGRGSDWIFRQGGGMVTGLALAPGAEGIDMAGLEQLLNDAGLRVTVPSRWRRSR
jgi:prevent-host-death family protein